MAFITGLAHFVREQESLARYTWLRVGGPAQYFAEPTTRDELTAVVRRAHAEGLPVRVLGGGSNLLVRDEGVAGVVVHLSAAAFGQIAVAGKRLTAGGGAKLGHVISTAVREGLAGLEELAGIPGTLGGALRGNASAHAGDIGQWTAAATMLTREGELVSKARSEMRFAYHSSSLDELVILEASFDLEPGDSAALTKRMQHFWILQKAAQPLTDQSTGRLFKDPGGLSAAQLIEDAGLKTARVGEAAVSDRNPNFVVASRGATAADVLGLLEHLRQEVERRAGVALEPALDVW